MADDLRARAREVVHELSETDVSFRDDVEIVYAALRDAVAAERERAAQIAANFPTNVSFVRESIAAAIRGDTKP